MPSFKMVQYQDQDHEPVDSDEDAQQPLGEVGYSYSAGHDMRALKRKLWCLHTSLALTLASLLTVTAYAVLVQTRLNHLSNPSYEWSGRLGEDPSGFVPQGIGEPLELTYYDKDHPYFFPDDMFDDLDTSMAMIRKVRSMHNSSNVLVNQRYAKWFHPDGAVTHLAPFFSWKSTRQMYTLRGFHQFTCILAIAEEYTHRVHTNTTSRWGSRHVTHCMNTLRDAVMCMADATPMSFVNGFQMNYITQDQAYMCRDWEALRTWANEPERGVRTLATDDTPVQGELQVGALYDFEEPEEIVPFPLLTEQQRAGLA